MSPLLVFCVISSYFLMLIAVSFLTTKSINSESFYTGNKQSPWFLVAFGMIGASLSGVTFISVPGEVGNSHWYYFQLVLGYLLGYFIIATVLMPIYYRMNLISIYSYLETRFGFWSFKTGAFFFLISKIIGAGFRLFLVANVLQILFFDAWGLPFWVSVLSTILLVWVYTFKGGIKTIVWTDTLQTIFMLASVLITIFYIKNHLYSNWTDMFSGITNSQYSTIFNWNWQDKRFFLKQFLSGAFIAIVMTGLDQDMMQKNLTCKNIKEAQLNMFTFSVILLIVNVLFLTLGVLLYQYALYLNITNPEKSDDIFPLLASKHFSLIGGITFLLGIISAAYSSADSALTSLTTSFCVDFLGFNPQNFQKNVSKRIWIHLMFSFILFIVVLVFYEVNDKSVINAIFIAAGYTYGPLLGLYSFGIFTKYKVKEQYIPIVCIISPILSFILSQNSVNWFGGYKFGFELLLVNGLLTFMGIFLLKKNTN